MCRKVSNLFLPLQLTTVGTWSLSVSVSVSVSVSDRAEEVKCLVDANQKGTRRYRLGSFSGFDI
jgi:hypothetical protein